MEGTGRRPSEQRRALLLVQRRALSCMQQWGAGGWEHAPLPRHTGQEHALAKPAWPPSAQQAQQAEQAQQAQRRQWLALVETTRSERL